MTEGIQSSGECDTIQKIYEEFQKGPLGSRYQMNIQKLLGSGSQAKVFEIQNKNSEEKFAMKVYKRDIPEKLKKSEQESLQILGQGQSEYVVKMIECCTYNERLWIVLELCECDLITFWNKQKKILGLIDEEEIFSILKFLCNVYYDLMMNAIIHRDLKPENILVTKQMKYKLTDFGISKKLENFYSQNMSTKQQGTSNYMSPQQHLRLRYTSKCDVWAAGIIIYQLHQGVFPWGILNANKDQNQNKNENIKQFFKKANDQGLQFNRNIPISQELKEILHKLLAYEENDRYSWFDLMQHKNIKTERFSKFQQQYEEKEKKIIDKIKSSYSQYDCSQLLLKVLDKNIDPNGYQAKDIKKKIVKLNSFRDFIINTLKIPMEESEILFLFNKIDHKQENKISFHNFKKWLEDNQIIKTDRPLNQETIIESIVSYNIQQREEDPSNAYYYQECDENQIFDQIFKSVNPIIYGLIRKIDYNKQLDTQIFLHNLKILFHQYEKQLNQQYQGYIDYYKFKKLILFLFKEISDELIYHSFQCFDHNQTNQITAYQFEEVLSEYYQRYIYHINYVILTLVIAIRNYNCDVNLLFDKYKQKLEQAIKFEGFHELIKQIDQDITKEQIELAFDYFCLENLQHIKKQRFTQIIELYKQKL